MMIGGAFIGLLAAGGPVWAEESDAKAQAELTTALKGGVKVPLEKGLEASEREGKPISAKFEVEDGKLQLSAYTMKGEKFAEVIVDHETGKVVKTEAITGGEDLAAAKEQSDTMAKAKLSLAAAAKKALKANRGFRPVGAVPAMKDGHPTAEVTLVKDKGFKTVSVKLD
jgi:hypothetical protein